MQNSMLAGLIDLIGDIFAGFFAIIPQLMYFLYASIASLIDMFQYVFRKVAGLDVYYVDGEEKSGDIVIEFIEGILGINKEYSALNTVFWSLIIFGLIVMTLITIITIIKAHYNYDEKKSSPFYIIKNMLKSIAAMALVPLCTIFGLFLSTALFRTLDTITSPSSESDISAVYEDAAMQNLSFTVANKNEGDLMQNRSKRYASFDMFGVKEWSNTVTFSGMMFEACANQANRVRNNSYTPNGSGWDDMGIFFTESDVDKREIVADQIDYAFANNLTLKEKRTVQMTGDESGGAMGSSLTFGPSAAFAAGLINVNNFSKYNVGLVWYYYNLWAFNFIIGFGGLLICLGLFSNILFGMLMRIIISAVLFIIYPPVAGLMPFDEGNGLKSWTKQFMGYVVSAYSAVLGMNILFLLLPVFNSVTFLNIDFLDSIIRMMFVLAGLSMIKRLIDMLSKYVGAKNINEIGEGLKKEATKPVMKGLAATTGFAVGAVMHVGLGKSISQDIKSSKTAGRINQWAANSEKVKKAKASLGKTKAKIINSKIGKGAAKIKNGTINVASKAYTKVAPKMRSFKQGASNFVNKAMDNAFVKTIAGQLGMPIDPHSKDDYEEIEEKLSDGSVVKKTVLKTDHSVEKPKYKQVLKNAIIDFSSVALKAVGNASGIKGMLDKIDKDTNAIDNIKEGLNALAKELHLDGGKGYVMQTKGTKKEKEKEEAINEAVMNLTIENITKDKTLETLERIIEDIKK